MAAWKLSPGDFCHIHVPAVDRDEAKRFYQDVFGWELSDFPGTEFSEIKTSQDGIRGVLGPSVFDEKEITTYILVEDVGEALGRVERSGGKTLAVGADLPEEFGEFALASDPEGRTFGLWKKP